MEPAGLSLPESCGSRKGDDVLAVLDNHAEEDRPVPSLAIGASADIGTLSTVPYADPDMQRVANREHMRRRRASRTLGPLVTGELRLRKAADVLAVLDNQVAAVLDDEALSTAERARLIATLAGVALRAIEASDLAARLEAVEHVLRARTAA